MKEVLSQNNVQYLYVDICESIGRLKSFLKIRDTSEAHREAREKHQAGIPCLAVDEQVILVKDAEHMRRLIEEYQLAAENTQ
ncbi:MAG: hypothetical protein KH353_02655 [Clostridium sp.]|nr:hypothetical protein [Clostridium sp.]